MLIKSYSKFTLQFWKEWVKTVVHLIVYTTFIDIKDTWQNANRSATIFQKIFVFFEADAIYFFKVTELLKLWCNIYEPMSLFSFNILIGIYSIVVPRVLFDFGFKKLFNKSLAFPPMYRDFYRLLLVISKDHWVPRMLFVL